MTLITRIFGMVRCAATLLILFGSLNEVNSQETLSVEDTATRTKERVAEMATVISRVSMTVVENEKGHEAIRSKDALLRMVDLESGKKMEDGSLWLWSYQGLPVAMVELWANDASHNWGTTLLAVSSKVIRGQIGKRDWTPTPGGGVKFRPVPKADKPHKFEALRKAQMRKIARRFTANIVDPGQSDDQRFRLLTEPVHRYKGGDVEDGAIFAFVRGQSNPEVLLFIQTRDGKWEFGFLRCSSNELVARLDKNEIWAAPQIPGWIGDSKRSFWVAFQQYSPDGRAR